MAYRTAAAIVVGEGGSATVPPSVVDGLLAAASAVLFGHLRLTAQDVYIRPKPIPVDGEPVLGAVAQGSGP